MGVKNKVLNKDTQSCWVCNARFKGASPPGNANKEEHHVFPRNAGGTDGPLVFICDSHHATSHKIAERVHRKASFTDLLESSQDINKKLCWLASMIVKAEASAENDPNKLLRNSIQLSSAETAMLKKLQTIYPQLGRNGIFRSALLCFYKRHFP